MKLLVGLGNPGNKYTGTRHNVGFALLDAFAAQRNLTFADDSKFKGELATASNATHGKVVLLKPTTFMNLSGESVITVSHFFKLQTSDILVVHDEIDLPLGTIRFARGGSAAGHNGIKSIMQHLGSENFARLKIGVGRPKFANFAVADYVLQKFASEEQDTLKTVLTRCEQALETYLQDGLDAAMSQFHQKKPA